jgi:cytochrome c oxidase subunit 1
MDQSLTKNEFIGHEEHAPEAKRSWLFTRPDHKTGIVSWLTTVDHKRIGFLYGISALFFFLVGGAEALMIRMQLAVPNNDFISAQTYNEMFTMHATTMIFLAVMPLSAAFFNYIMPLQIGARDVAFPRLNGFAYWLFLAGAIVLNVGFFVKSGLPDMGWFGYAPLTSTAFSSEFAGDMSTDMWVMGLQILGVSSVIGSLNFIVTIINMRAPGLTMMRLPVFTWMTLFTAFLIILSFPAITIALVEVMMDRNFGTLFFEVSGGGLPILWQHLFWVFGHPEVYILILPAMGIISEILPCFSRKPLFGYPIVVFSGAVIGLLGFGVWSHHMFTTGMGTVATAAFTLATMAIAVPTGVKIFNWIGTLWQGHLMMRTPMMFALGHHALGGPRRRATAGQLLRRGSLPLRAHRWIDLRPARRYPLLVPADVWAEGVRILGQVVLLGHFRRIQHHLLPAPLRRLERHAPPDLHLRWQHGME